MQMTGHMVHMEVPQMSWTMSWSGFLFGLSVWSALLGVTGILLSVIYNREAGDESKSTA